MARIIYGVAGEGFGHSSRSHLIGQRLIDAGHDLIFVGSRKSLLYLRQYFGPPKAEVKEIFGLSFAFEGGRIDKSQTLKKNLLKLPEANRRNDELFKQHFEPFDPELIISDFEPFSAWWGWAWRNGVPFVSIDHEHVLTLCKLEHKAENWFSRLTAQTVTRCHYVGAVSYIIINFFKAPLRIDSAVLAPPVVRPVVTELKPTPGEHILLYSTIGEDHERLRDMLGKFGDYKFFIYGFDKTLSLPLDYKNCAFKKRSTEGFLNDLAAARGVIASAGFSLISECLYLKKKMLLLPVAGQYEQVINAHYIEKLGLGISAKELDEPAITRFLDELDKPIPDDERILWPDNKEFFKILQQQLNSLDTPVTLDLS
ncbi:MAG TPA: glycosyltransferase family protein [Sedimentisphaerales bacterium]|nr:glycosyltransferase family protein [Sedimentisphaerales bacterium]